MKKLELKNLKVKKLSKEEQSTITGGQNDKDRGSVSDYSEDMCCNETSAWPIDCS